MSKAINGIKLKEADTVAEKKLLGVIDLLKKEIVYGKAELILEFKGGSLNRLEVVRSNRSVILQD